MLQWAVRAWDEAEEGTDIYGPFMSHESAQEFASAVGGVPVALCGVLRMQYIGPSEQMKSIRGEEIWVNQGTYGWSIWFSGETVSFQMPDGHVVSVDTRHTKVIS